MFRIGQAMRMAAVALGVRRASPVPRHFSVALNYHLGSQIKNHKLPWDFSELYNKQQQKRRFASEAVNVNDNHGEDKKETRVSSYPCRGNFFERKLISDQDHVNLCIHILLEMSLGISVTFVDKDSEEKTIQVPVGMSMLEAAHQNDIELEGACEGSIACSTCHVIVMDENVYNKLEEPTDEENDMLDLAFGLTETSRLGCQVIAKPELDGMRLALPAATRNFAVDGYVPKPH